MKKLNESVYNALMKLDGKKVFTGRGRSKITSFGAICREAGIPVTYKSDLKNALVTSGVMIQLQPDVIGWNTSKTGANRQLAEKIEGDIRSSRLNVLKRKKSPMPQLEIFKSESLVTELRRRGFEVSCIKTIKL